MFCMAQPALMQMHVFLPGIPTNTYRVLSKPVQLRGLNAAGKARVLDVMRPCLFLIAAAGLSPLPDEILSYRDACFAGSLDARLSAMAHLVRLARPAPVPMEMRPHLTAKQGEVRREYGSQACARPIIAQQICPCKFTHDPETCFSAHRPLQQQCRF